MDRPRDSQKSQSITSRYFFQPVEKAFEWIIDLEPEVDPSIQIEEVKLLIRYAAENGIDPPGPDSNSKDETTIILLNNAVHDLENIRNLDPPYSETYESELKRAESEMLFHYTRLSRKTKVDGYSINGRTLIDTRDSGRAMFFLGLATVGLSFLAITNEVLISYVNDEVFAVDGTLSWVYFIQEHVFTHIAPFIWGALGGCIYLAMRLYEFASNRAFDRSRYHGWLLRVMLASIIGAVMIFIIDPTALTDGGIPIEAKTIAFLSGLGVKVVYGGFEKLVNTLVEKFNLGSLRKAVTDESRVREYLARMLADPGVADDLETRKSISKLLEGLGKQV